MSADRVLLLFPTNTYRAEDFLEAARRLGIDVVVGTDEEQALQEMMPGRYLSMDFRDIDAAVDRIVRFAAENPLDAVVGADDESVVVAAAAARQLELPHNPPEAVACTRDKLALRESLAAAGLPGPWFRVYERSDDPDAFAREQVPAYPCVLKPTFLSASRGVIRADRPDELVAAAERIGAILEIPEVAKEGGGRTELILVEGYVPGNEYAIEAVLRGGRLHPVAVFDKPDPLVGPHFEETIYVTPGRLGDAARGALLDAVAAAVEAVGLREGPVHAELRLDPEAASPEPVVLEIAARAIGGLCPRVLRSGTGRSLEELILMWATGRDFGDWSREERAAGVMMIPIPRAGILASVEGVETARAVAGVDEVTISINRGQRLVPLPEGNRYLGFIFARADDADGVEAALRRAHDCLTLEIRPARP